ncbi:hypothetical protein HDK77DRAFT_486785 [Phyllosticta capitalensis]
MESVHNNPLVERTQQDTPDLEAPNTLPASPQAMEQTPPKSFVNPLEVLHDPTLAPGYSASDPVVPFFEKSPFTVFPLPYTASIPILPASHDEEPLIPDAQSMDHDTITSSSRSVSPALEAEQINNDSTDDEDDDLSDDDNADADDDSHMDGQTLDHLDHLSDLSDPPEGVAVELQGNAAASHQETSSPTLDQSTPTSSADSPRSAGKWTEEENQALIESVKWAVRNKEPEVTVLGMWEIIAARMEETHGFYRTDNACRIWYNRKLRKISGFDERNTPNPNRMTTSSL